MLNLDALLKTHLTTIRIKEELIMKQRILFIISIISTILYADGLDMEKLKGMQARSIGPAGMSGRVTAIDVVLANTDVMYLSLIHI